MREKAVRGDILETLGVVEQGCARKLLKFYIGEVTERLKVHDWKSCVLLTRVPGVRIPPSPPLSPLKIAISTFQSNRAVQENRFAFGLK